MTNRLFEIISRHSFNATYNFIQLLKLHSYPVRLEFKHCANATDRINFIQKQNASDFGGALNTIAIELFLFYNAFAL